MDQLTPRPLHSDEPATAAVIDPVCGMTVDPELADAKGLTFTHEGVEYAFCGRGCRLEFEDDPETYLSPDYVAKM